MRKTLLICLIAISAGSFVSLNAQAKSERGIVLSKEALRSVGKVQCGKVKGQWIAGTHLNRNRFVSHQMKSDAVAAEAKRTKGSSRASLAKEAKRLKTLARQETRRCKSLNVPRGYRLPLFNLDRSVTVAVKSGKRGVAKSSTSGAKQLVKIDDTGAMIPALVSGDPKIKRVFTTASGRMFLYTDIHLEGTEMSKYCVLYEVNRINGTMNCVDRHLSRLDFAEGPDDPVSQYSYIQVDSSGALYYTGQDIREVRHGLKKFHRGKAEYVYSSTKHSLLTFVALSDGRILLSKRSEPQSPESWLRLIHPSGKTETLLQEFVGPMKIFPDGNVYFTPQDHLLGMRRFITATNTIDPKYWISLTGLRSTDLGLLQFPEAYHSVQSVEAPQQESKWIPSLDQTMFALQFNEDPDLLSWCYGCKFPGWANRLYQAYPYPRRVFTSLAHVEDAVDVGGALVLSGEKSPGQFATILFDKSTDNEVELVPPLRRLRMEFLTYVSESNVVVFYGQDMATSQWITGTIDLASSNVSISSRSTAPLSNMQTFAIG